MPKKPILRFFLRPFVKDSKGAVAVEFALIAAPFFLLVFAIFEVALVFLAETLFAEASLAASRLIKTGQAQAAGFVAADFQNEICSRLIITVFDCSRIVVDVQNPATFGAGGYVIPAAQYFAIASNFSYVNTGPSDLVLVRVFYNWDPFIPPFTNLYGNLPNGQVLFSFITGFRNEPFAP